MLIAYARVSKTDGSESLDLQRDALRAAGIDDAANLYHDLASGVRDDRSPARATCSSSGSSPGWAGISPTWRGPGGCSPGQGAQIDTTTAAGRPVFGIFAALAEFEEELIRELTVAGLKAGPGLEAARAAGSSRCRKP